MGVDGVPAEKLTVGDIESMLTGHTGTLVRLLVCSGKELQAHADQVQARADLLDLEAVGMQPSQAEEHRRKLAAQAVDIRMRDVVVELLPGKMADAFEDHIFAEPHDPRSGALLLLSSSLTRVPASARADALLPEQRV